MKQNIIHIGLDADDTQYLVRPAVTDPVLLKPDKLIVGATV